LAGTPLAAERAATEVEPRPPILRIEGLSKTFPGTKALDQVDLTIGEGEIHALIGQNGSGKSTLIKILAGYHVPEPGAHIEVNGQVVPPPLQQSDYLALGIGFVHQDLGLFESMSVLENLRVSSLTRTGSAWLSWSKERRAARETLARFDLHFNLDAPVSSLSRTDRAMLAIVRTFDQLDKRSEISGTKGLAVLDEPTAFLPAEGKEKLYGLIREFARSGGTVLFVSHDLEEVLEITDRVTVLRDGRVCGTRTTRETSPSQLVELIVGHSLGVPTSSSPVGRLVVGAAESVHVDGLKARGIGPVDLEVGAGEVVGLAGLIGSGADEIPYLLFGAMPAQDGLLHIGPASYQLARMSPDVAMRAGLALVPADRLGEGAVNSLKVLDNITLPVLDSYYRKGWLQRGAMASDASDLIRRFRVRPPTADVTLGTLSGGNQQKVLLAKWLQSDPVLLLLHEPTQGVDVGAREQIFAYIRQAADQGVAILCASHDHEQLAIICDRVLVMSRGRIAGELTGEELSQHRITEACLVGRVRTMEVG
jgi:ribose transport system ATP-binding protein